MKAILLVLIAAGCGVFANPFIDELNAPTLSEPIEFAGTGDDFFTLHIVAPAVARISHDGVRNFVVVAFDAGERRDMLVNHIGSYSGDRPLGFSSDSPVEIEVRADGDWTLTLLPLHMVPAGAHEVSGRGDAVLNIADVPGRALVLNHDGSKNFVVLSHGDGRRGLLVNHVGSYSGRVRLPDRTIFLEIVADGNWNLAVE